MVIYMIMNREKKTININSQINKLKYEYFNYNKDYKDKESEKDIKTERFK